MKISRIFKRFLPAATASLLAVLLPVFSSGIAAAASGSSNNLAAAFNAAAGEFGVPASVLMAVSYNESQWQAPSGPSIDNGYGVMDLRTYAATTVSGRDGKTVQVPRQAASYYTLDQAAGLLHESVGTLKTDTVQNIRGGAAVLAQEARSLNHGQLPASVGGWYSAVAEFAGASDSATAGNFANDVFSIIKTGASAAIDGQTVSLAAQPTVQPSTGSLTALGLNNGPLSVTPPSGQPAECPKTLNCRFIPAAYVQNNSADPTDYGNYDKANRPHDLQIKYIYIHDGEGSYDSIINHFQDPHAYDSSQYVISSQGGVTQMVTNEDVSWGVANWNMNTHGINIEHEGFAAQGATWYTPAMYQASAQLVRWLAAKYNVPLDRQHILGHTNIMYLQTANQAIQHWDPGPFWNWNYFMDLVHGETPMQAASDYSAASLHNQPPLKQGDVVTIDPNFATNQPTVTDCQTGTCVTLPKQGANFVYLYTKPDASSPLLSDPYLHPDGTAGTTQDNDWGDKAPSGETYVVADVQGDWTGIWYAGQIGWFYNPSGSGRTGSLSWNHIITPRRSTIPVYTTPYPEASAYPSVIPVQPQYTPYSIAAGQAYTTPGTISGSDYYYAITANYSLPDDHDIVIGNQKYYEITYNHHIGFVKAEDVVVR